MKCEDVCGHKEASSGVSAPHPSNGRSDFTGWYEGEIDERLAADWLVHSRED